MMWCKEDTVYVSNAIVAHKLITEVCFSLFCLVEGNILRGIIPKI